MAVEIVGKIILTMLAIVLIAVPLGDIPPLVRKSRRDMSVPRSYYIALRVERAIAGAVIIVGVWVFPAWRSAIIRSAILLGALCTFPINRIFLGVWY